MTNRRKKPEPVEYAMIFEINSDEDFIPTHIKRDKKKWKLREVAKIEKGRIDRIGEWDNVNKVNFTMLDLSIDRKTIESAAENSNH